MHRAESMVSECTDYLYCILNGTQKIWPQIGKQYTNPNEEYNAFERNKSVER